MIGREKEISGLYRSSRGGPKQPRPYRRSGVGKTAIVKDSRKRYLARCGEFEGQTPLQLSMGNTVPAQNKRRVRERMRKLVKEVKEAKDVILFIDEIHTLVGAGGLKGL